MNDTPAPRTAASVTVASESLVVGLDGGGTKTVCLLARAQGGAVLGRGVGGPGNIHAVGTARVADSFAAAVRAAFADAGLPLPAGDAIAVAALGCAGVDRDADRATVTGLLREAVRARRYVVVNDGAIALRAAIPNGAGALVIAGTGTIAYGRDAHGREQRAGGWGYLADDVGSAYKVGLDGLTALLRAYDGRGERTVLSETLLRAVKVDTPPNLMGWIYRLPPPREEIAALGPLVAAAARQGDAVAARLMAEAGTALGELAATVIGKLDLPPDGPPVPVVTDGGFLRTQGDLLLPHLLAYVEARGLTIAHRHAEAEPAHGALVLARETPDNAP